ncbi:polyhydroxyalkanoate synthesis regulator DNA-binding domain-containing protein [Tsukamurella sp. PLM1]|uniref:polyhydroxyalkanoate synthesis regulator DNA-binding domain-containing protein n=1 Tax=Tsukamurella sp. PLM1 TaxID=2929795 RepID=UPI002057DE93|nr:polyhydroxyalkanoate synthesis regulator DNA-binding domain-containing protein [Tsukamurella sp. PLM1]BDH58547.1 hypothetical protein MTP03_34860 [Tsukamurella sp. PLM1]
MTDDEPYLIKRYSNRKLYDSVRRRFTTLDEIAALLDSGVRVLVRDHEVGTDRTDEVLAQVLRRQAQSSPRSSSLLADLLRAPADVAQTVVTGIKEGAGQEADGAAPGKGDKPKSGKSAKSKATPHKGAGATKKAGAKKPKDPDAEGDRRDEEIRELREQVSQLTEAVTLLLKEKTGE